MDGSHENVSKTPQATKPSIEMNIPMQERSVSGFRPALSDKNAKARTVNIRVAPMMIALRSGSMVTPTWLEKKVFFSFGF